MEQQESLGIIRRSISENDSVEVLLLKENENEYHHPIGAKTLRQLFWMGNLSFWLERWQSAQWSRPRIALLGLHILHVSG